MFRVRGLLLGGRAGFVPGCVGFRVALLLARLRGRQQVPGIDADIARRDRVVLRFALMLGVPLLLYLGLTVAVGRGP